MLRKTKDNYYFLEKFDHPGILHAFSEKILGDMSLERNIVRFLAFLKLKKENLILMGQVHGNKVKVVRGSQKGRILPGIDGMASGEKGIILGVRTADCLPILFYESQRKIIGVAHAGWKGILSGVVSNVLKEMVKLGAQPENILVGIGPHIGGCCYKVSPQRAKVFQKKFSDLPGMVSQENGNFHLNLTIPVVFQLEAKGVRKENIEVVQACTFCQNKNFFSFRKEKTNKRILGIICLK